MSYQTVVALVLIGFNTLATLIAANVDALGLTNPWVTLVVLPFAVAMGTVAANQMKSIGSPPPSTTKTVETVEKTTTPDKP